MNRIYPTVAGQFVCSLLLALAAFAGTPTVHLPLDDGAPSTVATDVSGNGHSGVLENMDANVAWTNGQFGGALSFDGVDDQLVMADDPGLSFGSGDFSVAFWYWKRANTFSFDNVWGVNKLGSVDHEWALSLGGWNAGGGNTPWFTVWIDGVAYVVSTNFTTILEWHHLVGVREGDTISIYFDGQLAASRSLPPGATMAANGEPVLVAVNSTEGVSRAWSDAAFDDIRLYDFALSAMEIEALFDAASPNNIFEDNFESGDTTSWSVTVP